jgi:hypothetical protein
MINPVKTQFNPLFSTTCFGLAVHDQVEQKCKEIYIYIYILPVYMCNGDLKTLQFILFGCT